MSIKAKLLACISLFLAIALAVFLVALSFLWNYLYSDEEIIFSFFELEKISIIGIFLLVILFISLITIMGIILYITVKSILKPLDGLVYMATEIKKGNLDCNIEYNKDNEFGKVYTEFDQMRKRLKKTLEKLEIEEELKREMIISATHDLKTPITSILGYSEGILSGIADTEEKKEKYIRTIMEKALVINKLVNNLYSFAKLNSDVEIFEMETYQAKNLLTSIIDEINPMDLIINLDVSLNENTRFRVDPFQLKRVLQNILQNSVEHSGIKSPKINISTKINKKNIILKMSDNGKEINEEECKKIFQRFYQVDPSRGSQNSGLGLNISQRIVEEMGGKIWARPSAEGGLAILISFPIVEGKRK